MGLGHLIIAAVCTLAASQPSAQDLQVVRKHWELARALVPKDELAALLKEAKVISLSDRGNKHVWTLAPTPALFQAANYAECILSGMPGAMNDAVAAAIAQSCAKAHPTMLASIEKGSGIGWFSFTDPQSCVKKKAGDTPNQLAARHIAISCHCLYGEPAWKGELCWRPAG